MGDQEPFVASRRRALVTAAGIATGAGCSAFTNDSSPSSVRLSRLVVQNEDVQPHTIEILVQRGRELLYWANIDFIATEENSIEQRCLKEDDWEKPGTYIVRAKHDDSESWIEIDTIDIAQKYQYRDEDYMAITIQHNGSDLSYYTSRNTKSC